MILLIVCFGWLILLQPQLTSHTSLKSTKDSLELQLTELKEQVHLLQQKISKHKL